MLATFFRYDDDFLNLLNRSLNWTPTSQTCRKRIWSPTSVTDIDVIEISLDRPNDS